MDYDGYGQTEGLESHSAMERVGTAMRPVHEEEQLLVSACGRTCQVDMTSARSLEQLQLFLQRALQMDGQEFQVCDINGNLLSTDLQVQDAIAEGLIPLCATLPDKSLHHLENRREELAQMQWKLVRDQITTSAHQFTSLTRQLSELQLQFQTFQREVQNTFDSVQQEAVRGLQEERQIAKTECLSLQEAVNGMSVLITTERNKRELAVQSFEKHVHGICDMVDSERTSRRQDLQMQTTIIEELKGSIEVEKANRERSEQSVADLKAQYWQLREELISSNNDLRDQIQRVEDSENTVSLDISTRFSQLEDRYATLETNVDNISSFNTQTVENLTERQERVAQSVETVRLSCKYLEGGVARITELENTMKQSYTGLYDRLAKEKAAREDGTRRANQSAMNDTRKQIGDLEKRLTIRLERESADREKNFKKMIDEVSNIVDDRKLFRDQVITKTIKVEDSTARTQPSVVGPSNYLKAGEDSEQITNIVPISPSTGTMASPLIQSNLQQRQLLLSASNGAITSMVVGSVFGSPSGASMRAPASNASVRAPAAVSSTGSSTPQPDYRQSFIQPGAYMRSSSPVAMMRLARNGSPVPSARSASPYPVLSSSLVGKVVD